MELTNKYAMKNANANRIVKDLLSIVFFVFFDLLVFVGTV